MVMAAPDNAIGHIVFRCDASPEIGSGHVMRCLTLAHYLSDRGFRITFVTAQESLQAVPLLKKSGFAIRHDEAGLKADWLVVDHYGLDSEYETVARSWAHKIFVIDDLANRPHDCDVVLDQNLGAKETQYKAKVGEGTQLLLGPAYAIIRLEFAVLRKENAQKSTDVQRLAVSFGGVNPKNATQRIIKYLEKFQNVKLDIDVIFGGDQKAYDDIQNSIPYSAFHGYHLHQNAHDVARILSQADMAIGAGGTVSWERCSLGLPTIALQLADNQKDVLKALDDAGGLVNLGMIEDLQESDFLEAFFRLYEDSDLRVAMGKMATSICDGRGLQRLHPHFIPVRTACDDVEISLRYAMPEDCKTVFDWQSEDGIRRYSRDPNPPSWDEHQAWYAQTMETSDRNLYIVECARRPCGFVRLDYLKEQSDRANHLCYEVSILISERYQAQGIGQAALELLDDIGKGYDLHAEVQDENVKSIEVFTKAGYAKAERNLYVKKASMKPRSR